MLRSLVSVAAAVLCALTLAAAPGPARGEEGTRTLTAGKKCECEKGGKGCTCPKGQCACDNCASKLSSRGAGGPPRRRCHGGAASCPCRGKA